MAEYFTKRDYILAARIGKAPELLAPHVQVLLHCNAMGSKQKQASRGLSGKIAPDEYEDFFVNLCKGLQYSFDRFHTVIPHVNLVDRIEINGVVQDATHFNVDTKTMSIPRSAIEDYVKRKRNGITANRPLMRDINLSADENIIMAGVEIGYAVHQKLNPLKQKSLREEQAKIDQHLQINISSGISAEDMAESVSATGQDMHKIRREALKDLKLGPHHDTQKSL